MVKRKRKTEVRGMPSTKMVRGERLEDGEEKEKDRG